MAITVKLLSGVPKTLKRLISRAFTTIILKILLHAGPDKGPDALSNSGCRCPDKTEMQLSSAHPSSFSVGKKQENKSFDVNSLGVTDGTDINSTLEPEFNKARGP